MIWLMALLLLAYGLLTLRGAVRPSGHLLIFALLAFVLWQPVPPVAIARVQPQSDPAQSAQPVAAAALPAPLNLADATLYPQLTAMPAELALYTAGTVQQVADFFNVRPGDILGILRAENNDAGYRVAQPAASSAGARGVAQVVPRTWNGWSNPVTDHHLHDVRSIEAHGGIGFDWSMREEWAAWVRGESDGSALAAADADVDRFANGVAAIARHLVKMGLTRDFAERDPAAFRTRLQDGIAIYNSGKPLSESADFTQSKSNRKTVAQYVAGAMAVSDSTPVHLGGLFKQQAAPLRPTTNGALMATPLSPMPPVFKGFGVAVDYQAGGTHTGIDVANPREGGQEPPIYAVADGEVVHVGPLYCNVATACRGSNAIIIHHGDHLYTIYSHNSSAAVVLGQRVAAGAMIGRQGNEGYSFGSHLHFEVHTGAPYSGNWVEPWTAGQFEDPAAWLP